VNASMGRGLPAAVTQASPPMRAVGPRLAWAATASVIVHAALLYVPQTTSPSVSHPVMSLIVRTIAATADAAVSPSSAHEPANERSSVESTVPSIESAAAPVHARAAQATSEAAPAPTRTARMSPDRTPAHSAQSGPGNLAARDAAAPTRAQGPVYHQPGELDPPPRPLQDIEPVYPPEAGFQPGTVVLRLFIDETGTVDRVDVLQATPAGMFENAARTAFAAARFSPGLLAGIAVKCQLTIEVEFTPINRGSAVSGRTY
jgi:protein TonB